VDVFPDATLWQGWGMNMMLVGTRDGAGTGPGPVPEEHFRCQWTDPAVAPELEALGLERPEQLGALFLSDVESLAEATRQSPPLVDEFPYRLSHTVVMPDQAWAELGDWLDEEQGRVRFERSAWVRRHWPAALLRSSLAWFDLQRLVNDCPALSGGGARPPETVDRVLRRSPLRTLVLWLMGSGEFEQRIVERAIAGGGSGPAIDYHLGARALADRRYLDAEQAFRRAERRDPSLGFLRLYRAYALCLAGEREAAAALVRAARGGGQEASWEWLVETFELER
jgi:hypothetical protein